MLNEKLGLTVDADSHVLEPADTWIKYIDPRYRDRAIRIDHEDKGWEEVAQEIRERLAPLPAASQRKVLGANAVRFYNLPVSH